MTSRIKARGRAKARARDSDSHAVGAGLLLQQLWAQLPRLDAADVEPDDLRRALDTAEDERTVEDWRTLTKHLAAALSQANDRATDALSLAKQTEAVTRSLSEDLDQAQASLRYWKARARAENVPDASLSLNDAVRPAPPPKKRGQKPKYGPADFQLAQQTKNRVDPATGQPISERKFVERWVERDFPNLGGEAKRRKVDNTIRRLKNIRDAGRARTRD